MTTYDYDLFVIGGGSAGVRAARVPPASANGWRSRLLRSGATVTAERIVIATGAAPNRPCRASITTCAKGCTRP